MTILKTAARETTKFPERRAIPSSYLLILLSLIQPSFSKKVHLKHFSPMDYRPTKPTFLIRIYLKFEIYKAQVTDKSSGNIVIFR